jgi:predicted glycosyltransferase
MKRLMFYCQHILGIGHLIRSTEIVRGLTNDFQICFINGGEIVKGFEIPDGIELVNLPAIKTDTEFRELQVPTGFQTIDEVLEYRRDQLLAVFDRIQPDVLMIELFPFGRRRFSAELIPLLDRAKAHGTKIVCSLRDIVVTKQDQARHEEKVCKLMNRYFDLLLIHGDPAFIPLEASFSRTPDLNCAVHYTGYVVQGVRNQGLGVREQAAPTASTHPPIHPSTPLSKPLILTSVGGGRFGHDLLTCVAAASELLETKIPHHIQLFTGPFAPDAVVEQLQTIAQQRPNLTVDRYTPNLLAYMQQADLSISMAGYNTTMNVLTTGVRSMLLPFTGNDDQEQTIRSQRLEQLGVVTLIRPSDLHPEVFADRIIECLQKSPTSMQFDLSGVENTANLIRSIVHKQPVIV